MGSNPIPITIGVSSPVGESQKKSTATYKRKGCKLFCSETLRFNAKVCKVRMANKTQESSGSSLLRFYSLNGLE